MTRRQALQAVAVLLGGAVSSSVVGAVLGCGRRREVGSAWLPRTLSAEQDRLVTAIAETILPATDTPGAEAAGVNRFIDLLLSDWLDAEERDGFLAGLADFAAGCEERAGSSFLDLDAGERLAALAPLDEEAAEVRRAATAAGLREIEEPPFFLTMKEWTLAGYYTSEIGMTRELQHLKVAGSHAGCVPLAEVGRSWG